jgi:hypothetical protein
MDLENAGLVHLAEDDSARTWGAIYSHLFQDGIGEVEGDTRPIRAWQIPSHGRRRRHRENNTVVGSEGTPKMLLTFGGKHGNPCFHSRLRTRVDKAEGTSIRHTQEPF